VKRPFAAALVLAALFATPGAAVDPDARILSLARAAGQPEPVLRIGLDDGPTAVVSSRMPFRVMDPATGADVWEPRFEGELRMVAEGGSGKPVPSVYRVQVGAFATREAAAEELARLEAATGEPGIVHHDPDRGNWRVRLGRSNDRLGLDVLLDRLRALGMQGMWIAEEPSRVVDDVRLRLVDAAYRSHVAGERVVVVPAEGGQVEVGGKPYRGVVEIRASRFGTVRPINWVGLEPYLQGVVPAELGPEVWPQAEALKAQSVAARTYAWRNRGQFAEEGFDLCASPRCQAYAGASGEHPMSDRAVRDTAGEIMRWNGEPIVALYTATCGGHTEHGGAIFAEHAEPYLRGVPCRAEGDALRATVRGRDENPVIDETGADVTRDWALLVTAGVVPRSADPGAAIDGRTLRQWTSALAELAGRPAPGERPTAVETLADAAAALATDLGWGTRGEVLLDDRDVPALLRGDEDALALPREPRRALAYLAWAEAIRPFADGRYGVGRAATGARIARALVRIGESYRAFGLERGSVAAPSDRGLRLLQGKSEIRFPVADRPAAFTLSGGRPVPSRTLELWPGDRVRFRTNASGAIDFVEIEPPVKGTSDDRTAAVYSWEERRSRQELEKSINQRVSVGRLEDLEVVERGVSGRVTGLRVVGSRASSVVRGFDVRRLLELRESLLVMEIQRDRGGRLEAVVFAGKGWGHGVGLCQVGAYGMALRGASYREILGHYYTGVAIERIGR
jgi:stage II sporulation protein D